MASVELKGISKEYERGVCAVNDFSLFIRDGEFVVFVGPSGCGKSTVLRMIAGIERITSGTLCIGQEQVEHISAKERDIAMVFQNYALYPHMSVFKNMEFGLKMKGIAKEERKERILETARLLQIEGLLQRKPGQLSGGQKQRVALGRAMVRRPQVFLLDEPLSNLDAKLRGDMRVQLCLLHRQLEATFIYVTHDQTEAMTMADRIVVMKEGVIRQVGTPEEIYAKPADTFVAGFIGTPPMNFSEIERNGRRVIAGIRPEDLRGTGGSDARLSGTGFSAEGSVQFVEYTGAEYYIYAQAGQKTFVLRSLEPPQVQAGETMRLWAEEKALHLFDIETKRRLEC